MFMMKNKKDQLSAVEKYYMATQWQLIWMKFKKHKLAMIGMVLLGLFYAAVLLPGFLSTNDPQRQFAGYELTGPSKIHFYDGNKLSLRPFVYGLKSSRDPITLENMFAEDKTVKYPINFFAKGYEYRLWGFFKTSRHLLCVQNDGTFFLFGTDSAGRDLFSRNIYASRISLTIGLVGVAISFFLGCFFGGISGYFGGAVDMIIQRFIEFLLSVPTLPLWIALTAALPKKWSPIAVYFGITIILSLVGWCGLARVVRSKILSLREEDFVTAAVISGAGHFRIITRHLIPPFMSYLIVNVTLAIPAMILGETTLSFLGLGMKAPAISWGVLLKDSQSLRVVAEYPWLLLPGLFIIIVMLAFNFVGDGLRDAADPYK